MLRTEDSLMMSLEPIPFAPYFAGASECQEYLSDKLYHNPSIFGRLVNIAVLRSGADGRYEFPLPAKFGAALIDSTLRAMHREVFDTWLNFHVKQQQRDLSVWLAAWGQGRRQDPGLVRGATKRLADLIPARALEAERQFFLSNLQLLLTLFRLEEFETAKSVRPLDRGATKNECSTLAEFIQGCCFQQQPLAASPKLPQGGSGKTWRHPALWRLA